MDRHKRARLRRIRRHRRVRRRVFGTPDRPRLCVRRSLRHIYAQVIDDVSGRTLAACSSLSPEVRDACQDGDKKTAADAVGKELARRALEAGIQDVRFDRSGYKYHGRVKSLADAAREGGLHF
ncbi:MAG: 50S ribosomal protein L18 [Candidatus Brocadiia bacterium]